MLASIAIVRCTVCTVRLTLSAKGQQESSLNIVHYSKCAVYRLYCDTYSYCNRSKESSLNVGLYSNCALYRLYCETYSECNRSTGKQAEYCSL